MQEAYACLRNHDLDGAIRLAKKLKRLRHSSAYEILALALAARGKKDEAIETLKEGVGSAPGVWLLWQLLGNYLSDEGRYRDCEEAYRRALACPEVNRSWVHLNLAIALSRQERYGEALTAVAEVLDPELGLQSGAVTTEILNSLGRHVEAIALARETLRAHAAAVGDADEETTATLASLHAQLALGIWREEKEQEAALKEAWSAISLTRNEPQALQLIREVEGRTSPGARYYRLCFAGKWFAPFEGEARPPGFLVTCDVIAESPEEAMEIASRFEPPAVRSSLRIDECEEVEARPGELKGVCWISGHIFCPADED